MSWQAIFSMRTTETDRPTTISALSGLLGMAVTSLDPIGGGRNSRVFRVGCGTSGHYVAKFYPEGETHHRDRLEVEFTSLEFLRDHGVQCVPRPITADKTRGCAVYEYIEGEKVTPEETTSSDIDQAVRFMLELKELASKEESALLPDAAEACFSVQEILINIHMRLSKLLALEEDGPQYRALRDFLADEFSPSLGDATGRCETALGRIGIPLASELKPAHRTLSPSDFGFHNALRRSGGQIVFVDFEYFGWDDPAKMVSDFLLHPGMDLEESLKRQFLTSILAGFRDHPNLEDRVGVVYPLFGLKWCLILLNAFLPEYLATRGLVNAKPLDRAEVQSRQLSKARRMLREVARQ